MHRDVDVQSLQSNHSQEVAQLRLQALESLDQARQQHEEVAANLRRELQTTQTQAQERISTLQQQLHGGCNMSMKRAHSTT
jgi:hypothetical protein